MSVPAATPAAPRPVRWPALLARLAVTAGVLVGLLLWLPEGSLRAAFAGARVGPWLAAVAGLAAGHLVAALKWRRLLAAAGVEAGALEAVRAHGAGLFANFFLPSLVGGDLVRAGLLARSRGRVEAVAVASLADRLLDTGALAGLAAGGAAMAPGEVGRGGTAVLGVGAAALATTVLGLPWVLRRFDGARLPPRAARVLARLREATSSIAGQPALAGGLLLLSAAIQGLFVGLNILLGRAVGLDLPGAAWLLGWPLAKLTAMVPVSLGGLGVREAALAAYLAPFGGEASRAVATSLLWEAALLAVGSVGGAAALWSRRGGGRGEGGRGGQGLAGAGTGGEEGA